MATKSCGMTHQEQEPKERLNVVPGKSVFYNKLLEDVTYTSGIPSPAVQNESQHVVTPNKTAGNQKRALKEAELSSDRPVEISVHNDCFDKWNEDPSKVTNTCLQGSRRRVLISYQIFWKKAPQIIRCYDGRKQSRSFCDMYPEVRKFKL